MRVPLSPMSSPARVCPGRRFMSTSRTRRLASSPRGAIAFIIEARAATPAVREHHRQILERFAELTRHPDGAPVDDDPEVDRLFRLAGVIAVEDTAAYEIAQGRADGLLELE